MKEEFDIKDLTTEERIEYGKTIEAALQAHIGEETVAAIRKKAAVKRADNIEKMMHVMQKSNDDLRQRIDDAADAMTKAEWSAQLKKGAAVTDAPQYAQQAEYDAYLAERDILIKTRAAIAKQEQEGLAKQYLNPQNKAEKELDRLTMERMTRNGSNNYYKTYMEIAAENPELAAEAVRLRNESLGIGGK